MDPPAQLAIVTWGVVAVMWGKWSCVAAHLGGVAWPLAFHMLQFLSWSYASAWPGK